MALNPSLQIANPLKTGISETLARYRHRVEQALNRCLPAVTDTPRQLHEAMRYATLNGGKRIRASLVYAAGEALGATADSLDAPACAVELVHSYSLVHDDLPSMDNDDLRRGKPTCHKAFDEATALLAGDALQALAFEELAHNLTAAIDASTRTDIIGRFARAIGAAGMAGGQAIDLAATGKSLTLEELESMHRRKTGALIQVSVQMGALCAPACDDRQRQKLDTYAQAIGLTFQIVDDILDVEGSTETLGKTAGADQALNKPTYPALLGLNGAKTKAREAHEIALESIASLGDNGRILAGIADYILERKL